MTVPAWIEIAFGLLGLAVPLAVLLIYLASRPTEKPAFEPGELVQGPDRLFFDLGDPDGFGTAIVDSEDGRK